MESYEGYRQWKDWGATKFARCGRADASYFHQELARVGMSNVAGCRILEIGFGNGGFAAWAKDAGADYWGVEAIAELVAQARKSGLKAFHVSDFKSEIESSTTFNLVVAFDVFEHLSIEQLKQELTFLRTKLEPNGRLLARVPSGDSPFARAIQHGDLTHVSTLGSSVIRQLASQLGFEVVQIREPVHPLLGAGPAAFLKRMLIRLVRPFAFQFIRIVLMGNRDAVLTPNMVFVLAPAK